MKGSAIKILLRMAGSLQPSAAGRSIERGQMHPNIGQASNVVLVRGTKRSTRSADRRGFDDKAKVALH